jgi:hypothetical protein
MSPTRREFVGRLTGGAALFGLASSSVAVAGCLSSGSDDPEPIDVDESELAAIAGITVPDVPETLPVSITDGHIENHRLRAEELLDAVPSDLGEIPNEAVRNYIAEERDSARERLGRVDGNRPNFEQISTLTGSRRRAAEAEGAHAAARGERLRMDVYDAAESVRDRLSGLEDNLRRVGDVAHHAVVVYEEVEQRLERAQRGLDRLDNTPPVTSEVTAVGEAASDLESVQATLEVTSHILDGQSGDRTFDDEFERVARDLIDDLEDRSDVLPFDAENPGEELFEASVAHTPRAEIGQVIRGGGRTARVDAVREQLDEGQSAGALLTLYRLGHLLRTVDHLQERIQEGAYGRPENAGDVRSVKQTAVEEIEAVLKNPDYPVPTRHRIQEAVSMVKYADGNLESGRTEEVSVQAMGQYAVATEQARTLPAATEWFVQRLA